MHMITVKEALKMRILFNCLLIQFVCMDISLGYDDISAYKPTKQGHDRQILDVAANVVDRSFSTCSTTGASNPSWWYVDLQKVKSIYDVEIYFRLYDTYLEQRQRERMYGYKLYISNSTDFSLLHQAYLCYNHTGPELPELNVTHVCVSFGRYVIFYNERIPGVTYPNNKRYTYTQLCEVIVQGCDRDDVYGPFCNNTCPTNCQERRCYITNGTCAGCKDGWTGEKCHNECPSGTYGKGCEQNCSGNCFNNDTCYHVDGHCPLGCRDGFRGNRCDEQSVVVDSKSLCSAQRANVAGMTAGLVISLLINVGFCFLIVLSFIRKKDIIQRWKKENKKENDQPSYEVSDRGRSQQRSTYDDHLENHAYEDLNETRTTEASQIYRNLTLSYTRTLSSS